MNNVLPIAAAAAGLLGYAIPQGPSSLAFELLGVALALGVVVRFVMTSIIRPDPWRDFRRRSAQRRR